MSEMPAMPLFLCPILRFAPMCVAALLVAGPATAASATDATHLPAGAPVRTPQRILFVGDSLTHGRYAPVRSYGAMRSGSKDDGGTARVVDENFGQTGARAEREPGPWGGIPGIFARFAAEAGLDYEVHLEAISATSLAQHGRVASDVIDRPTWDVVVLQELSAKPLPFTLTHSRASDPAGFRASVGKLARGIRAAAPQARVYLYETWPRADLAKALAGEPDSAGFHARYFDRLTELVAAYRDAYEGARRTDPSIAAVVPVGRAWQHAWTAGVADPDPYAPSGAPLLWYGMRAQNDPPISRPDYLHPGVLGAYLSALVLFQQIAGVDVRTFGPREQAAAQLGIAPDMAARLQAVASDTVRQERADAASASDVDAGLTVTAGCTDPRASQ
ncbi:hypothetical protein WL88_24510 [Burkholderia diffusa]|uniref:SGNH/GDSL hydrolase family protein n=2 Tax=Burkholderia diffusa TaxID=488732 RepID=A0AAW3P9A8_9BURK|nr:hypothetical protein WL86_28520 [Burkholderia diffusa]KWF38458.1 hypothetical protein WL85_09695 [Burkholderia diffusa]KWF43514.1 hypothetical protein WL87_06135 [Burkholderia diffusa]KWF46504.1 hypothetical protein WL88_24510 [Burkholderia diffusa]